MRERVGLAPFSEIEVSGASNGDKAACNVTEIEAQADMITAQSAAIRWEPFEHHDMRTLLGYIVYAKEAPEQNVSMYESRDACGGDGWRALDVVSGPVKTLDVNSGSMTYKTIGSDTKSSRLAAFPLPRSL